jgi:hypothetical protein
MTINTRNSGLVSILAGALALTFTLPWHVSAQQPVRMQMSDATEITVTAENGVPEIPFEITNNHLLLPVTIDGEEFDVVLDTGMPAPGLALYGGPRVEALDLNIDPGMRAQVRGAGGKGEGKTAQLAVDESLELPGVRLDGTRFIIMPPSHFGAYHQGVIGYSLFNRFVVELDYDRGVMRLLEPADYEPPEGAHVLPLTMRHNVPYTRIRVTPVGGEPYETEVVVDLGASHAISLNTEGGEQISVPEGSLTTVLGRGLSGEILGEVGRIAELDLGGAVLPNLVASFPESQYQNPRGIDSLGGNLGSEGLRRFTTVFDYTHGRMVLVPNDSFSEPFLFDRSGVRFDHDGTLVVRGVLPGSPAAAAGIEVGDRLTHLNGEEVAGEDLYDVRDVLKGDGEISVLLERGGERLEKSLTLRRLI